MRLCGMLFSPIYGKLNQTRSPKSYCETTPGEESEAGRSAFLGRNIVQPRCQMQLGGLCNHSSDQRVWNLALDDQQQQSRKASKFEVQSGTALLGPMIVSPVEM